MPSLWKFIRGAFICIILFIISIAIIAVSNEGDFLVIISSLQNHFYENDSEDFYAPDNWYYNKATGMYVNKDSGYSVSALTGIGSPGLNLQLISEMKDGYLKEYMQLLAQCENGMLSDSEYHITLQALLGILYSESRPGDGNSYPKFYPKSYLPMENGEVVWNREYKGNSASQMTLTNFSKKEWNNLGLGKYCSWLSEKAGDADWTQFQIQWGADSFKPSKINTTGSGDKHNLPDTLAAMDRKDTEILSSSSLKNATKSYIDSADFRTAVTVLIHNRGGGGALAQLSGITYSIQSSGINMSDYYKLKNLDTEEETYTFTNSLISIRETAKTVTSKVDADKLLNLDDKAAMVIIAAHTDGWYFSPAAKSALNKSSSYKSLLSTWNLLYPEDNMNSKQDCINYLEKKMKPIHEAINEVNGTNYSREDAIAAYGSDDYDDYYVQQLANSNTYVFAVYHVSNLRSDIYTHKYKDGTNPFMLASFDTIPFGYQYNVVVRAPIWYAKILELGGVTSVDIADPNTYLNQISGVRIINDNGSTSYVYSASGQELPHFFKNCGIDTTKLSNARYKILMSIATQMGESTYIYGGKTPFGHLDCTAFVATSYALAGYSIGTSSTSNWSVNTTNMQKALSDNNFVGELEFAQYVQNRVKNGKLPVGYLSSSGYVSAKNNSCHENIDFKDLQTGDVLSCNGHAVIFLNYIEDADILWVADTNAKSAPHSKIRARQLQIVDKNGTTKTYGAGYKTIAKYNEQHPENPLSVVGYYGKEESSAYNGTDSRKYYCFRSIDLVSDEKKQQQTYTPSGSSLGDNLQTGDTTSTVISVTQNDVELLRKVVAAEAGNQEYKGKAAVAEVIINRVKSKSFPNSVYNVIYAKGQFATVTNGSINTAYGKMSTTVKEEINKAVDDALHGSNYCQGALYFRTKYYFSGLEGVTQIGDHYFSK